MKVVHDIVSTGLRPGDRLPSEADMLKHYDVSRESLREGLRLLETQGLITIKRGNGGGPFVGVPNPKNLGRTLGLYFHLSGATYDELFTAWELAEPLLAELAARNPDRSAVRDSLSPWLTADDVPNEEFVEISTGFHDKLATVAANRVLSLAVPAFTCIVVDHMLSMFDTMVLHDEILHDHEIIARAIIDGEATRARELMQAHVRYITDFYRANYTEDLAELVEWQ